MNTYALVKDGVVINTIVCEDAAFLRTLQAQYQYVVNTSLAQVGDTYNGSSFSPPTPITLSFAQQQQGNIAFGTQLIQSFVVQRYPSLTPAQRVTMMKSIAAFMNLAMVGDLNGMLSALMAITPDGTIITAAILTSLEGQIQAYQTSMGLS